jgi:hypothetical protein
MNADGKTKPGNEPGCNTPATDSEPELKQQAHQADPFQGRSPKSEPPPVRQKIASTLRCLRPD